MKLLLPVLLLALPVICSAGEKNRFNLSEVPESPRFELKGKTWPKEVGQAEICLWHDDKLAAVSLGVDDNFGNEIDWWKEQAALYDFKVTWFVISGRVGANTGAGYWEQFRNLEELGHAVESHTVTHLHIEDPGWGGPEWTYSKKTTEGVPAAPVDAAKGVEWEYAESVAQLEKNLPGKKVSALAYPGGKHTSLNDRNLAAKHFRVARGARGSANPANKIDYMSTNAMSSWHFGDAPYGWSNVRNILDQNLYRGLFYRGWAVLFAHGVSANPALFAATFEFLKENRENLWIGLFTDVARYGQERDTATLKVESQSDDKISFLLTDEMDDSYFNYPLTIKVRIPNEWKSVKAMQGDTVAGSRIVENEGMAYALVQTVPDAGLVTLQKN